MYYNYPDEYFCEVMKEKNICEVDKNELYRNVINDEESNIYKDIDCEYVQRAIL